MRPNHFGYLVIDHRASPGIPELGLTGLQEADTATCAHCKVPVVLNKERKRERFFCPKCDEYCCDICATAFYLNLICKPFEAVAEDVMSGKVPFPLLCKDMKE